SKFPAIRADLSLAPGDVDVPRERNRPASAIRATDHGRESDTGPGTSLVWDRRSAGGVRAAALAGGGCDGFGVAAATPAAGGGCPGRATVGDSRIGKPSDPRCSTMD